MTPDALAESLDTVLEIIDLLEHDRHFVNLAPYGEPQLGRRGLYRSSGGTELPGRELAILWTLNQSDGSQSLLDIAEKSELPFKVIQQVASELESANLLAVKDEEGTDA